MHIRGRHMKSTPCFKMREERKGDDDEEGHDDDGDHDHNHHDISRC